MLSSDEAIMALTAVLNLATGNFSDEREIPPKGLARGLEERIWPCLPGIRPRLVAPLTVSVWNHMLPRVEKQRVVFETCPVKMKRPPVIFRLEGSPYPSLFVKVPHPSRPMRREELDAVNEACRWFLAASR